MNIPTPESNPENWKTAQAPNKKTYYYNKVVNLLVMDRRDQQLGIFLNV